MIISNLSYNSQEPLGLYLKEKEYFFHCMQVKLL